MRVNFQTLQPKSDILRKYISYFYFDHSVDESANRYIYYPNHRLALTIYNNSEVQFVNNLSIAKPASDKKFDYVYAGLKSQSIRVEIHPPYAKIGIVFEPLGINHFLNESLIDSLLVKSDIKLACLHDSMEDTCDSIFAAQTIEEKAEHLEHYFLNQFHEFDAPLLSEAVSIIIHSRDNLSVNELCETLKVNRKSLLRQFHKHLNCSIKQYIDVVQFRNALDMYVDQEGDSTLTQIAYENGYYDQSEFIKHFKKVTGYNPKRVLSTVNILSSKGTFWTQIS